MLNKFFGLLLCSLIFGSAAIGQDPSTTTVSQATVVPKGYVYGPGDQISGKIIGEQDYNFTAIVDENGNIELPFSGTPIVAQCKTQKQLKEEITEQMKKYLKDPAWNLLTDKRIVRPVTVYGEVNDATKIELTRRTTLLEVVAFAKGATKDSGRVVQVYRPTRVPCSGDDDPFNWKPESGDPNEVPSRTFKLSAMGQGTQADNPMILPGDIIYVPQATPVYITGEVRLPGAVLLKKDGGTTLFQAVTMVNGVNPEAKSKDVKIYRKKAGSIEQEVISANLDKIKKGEQADIFLEPYDMVVVDKSKKPLALVIAEFAIGAGKQVVQSAANTGGMRVMY